MSSPAIVFDGESLEIRSWSGSFPRDAAREMDTVHNCQRPGRIVRAGYPWNCCTGDTPETRYEPAEIEA